MKSQFEGAGERKFILTCHVYAGSRWKGEQNFKAQRNTEYFNLLKKYQEKVIIEVFAHDHLADLRFHSTNINNETDYDEAKNFHNILIAPGIAPNKGQNPGIA